MIERLRKRLIFLLYFIAAHSFFVGICLVFIPIEYFDLLGFQGYADKFFKVQGGTFHIVMSFVYLSAAFELDRSAGLLASTILAKALAAVMLFSYYFFVEPIWMVLVSGVTDGALGVLVAIAYYRYRNHDRGAPQSASPPLRQ